VDSTFVIWLYRPEKLKGFPDQLNGINEKSISLWREREKERDRHLPFLHNVIKSDRMAL
jgi:hypothetical protein